MKTITTIVADYLSSKYATRKTLDSNATEILPDSFMPETKRITFFVNAVLFMFLSFCIMSGQAKAVGFAVNLNTDVSDANIGDGVCDSNLAVAGLQCTLRAAIQESNALPTTDNIVFSLSTPNTINLTIADLFISDSLDITGPGAKLITVQRAAGAPNFRIFFVQAGNSTVNISRITISNGQLGASDTGGGAAVLNNSGSCTLNLGEVTIKDNTSAKLGGAITNVGTLRVFRSTISNNTGLQGGAINNNGGSLNIHNSTISDNTATDGGVASNPGVGGGIINFAAMTLNNVTVSNNTATNSGGGITDSSSQASDVRNTIIAANSAPNDADISGSVTSQGNNLIGISNGSNGFTNNVNGDKVGTAAMPLDPLLGNLQDNGGQTDTRALSPLSPAVDAGNNCVVTATCPAANASQLLTTDHRSVGFPRSVDGNSDGIATVDIGAFEAVLTPTAADIVAGGRVTNAKGAGIRNVLVSLTCSNGETRTTASGESGYYNFSDVPTGETCIFSVSAKRYTFANDTQIRNITEDTQDIDFIANNSAKVLN